MNSTPTDRPQDAAVVALSGGQDSTTCLAYALHRYSRVTAVTFDYDQRHRAEIDRAESIAAHLEVPWTLLRVAALGQLADAALTDPALPLDAPDTYAATRGLPSTFVPGRNLVLLSLTAAYGLPRGYTTLVTGICAQDRAGYPDCRAEFAAALLTALRVGMDAPHLQLDAPLLYKTKAQTWQLADDLDITDLVINHTLTCYRGDTTTLHQWGYGCGACGACHERATGYATAHPNGQPA